MGKSINQKNPKIPPHPQRPKTPTMAPSGMHPKGKGRGKIMGPGRKH